MGRDKFKERSSRSNSRTSKQLDDKAPTREPLIVLSFRDFDANQPMIEELSRLRKFKSYYGLAGCLDKLQDLMNDFPFIDLASAEKLIDWDKAKIVKI